MKKNKKKKKVAIMHNASKNERVFEINQLLQKYNKSGIKSAIALKKDLIVNQCKMNNIQNLNSAS